MQREEPYLGLTCRLEEWQKCLNAFERVGITGAAWLSSARVVRCWVKSRNERNPYAFSCQHSVGHSRQTADVKSEEGGDDVKSSWPLYLGLHTCYNG